MFEASHSHRPPQPVSTTDHQFHAALHSTAELVCRSRRILMLGSCGAGKSHLARQLAAPLELPLVHLDDLYWGPDWSRPTPAEWLGRLERAASAEAWIMDGNHFSSLPTRLARAELVIMLDLPTWRCLASVMWRDVKRLWQKEDLPLHVRTASARPRTSPGRLDFWGQVLRFNRTTRPKMLKLLQDSGVPLLLLPSRRQARHLVDAVHLARARLALPAPPQPGERLTG